MTFHAFGLNHESAPVHVREAFSFDDEQIEQLYDQVELSGEAEWLLLATCNRTEIYLYGYDGDADRIREALAAEAGMEWPHAYEFALSDEEAVRHVLEVACGLRSLVLGDAQILSQIKEAYRLSVESGCVEAVLHRLLHTAFRTAKRVAHETKLGNGSASVSSAAVATARAFFEVHSPEGLQGRDVLLLGTGRMGVLALGALASYDLGALYVANRTPERARHVATAHGAEMIDWSDRHERVADADLVIVATGAEDPVLLSGELPEARSEHGTLVIDIAVPRNVSREVDEREGYTVFDLDKLNERLVRVEEQRRAAVPAAAGIVDEELSEFVSWYFHQQALQPAIHAVRDTFEEIRQLEIERHAHRFEGADREELDQLTRSIMQKLLAVPIVRLKSSDPESIDFVRGVRILESLFSRPECEDDESKACGGTETPVDVHERRIRRLRDRYTSIRTGDEQ